MQVCGEGPQPFNGCISLKTEAEAGAREAAGKIERHSSTQGKCGCLKLQGRRCRLHLLFPVLCGGGRSLVRHKMQRGQGQRLIEVWQTERAVIERHLSGELVLCVIQVSLSGAGNLRGGGELVAEEPQRGKAEGGRHILHVQMQRGCRVLDVRNIAGQQKMPVVDGPEAGQAAERARSLAIAALAGSVHVEGLEWRKLLPVDIGDADAGLELRLVYAPGNVSGNVEITAPVGLGAKEKAADLAQRGVGPLRLKMDGHVAQPRCALE